jgi:hypothetical protein
VAILREKRTRRDSSLRVLRHYSPDDGLVDAVELWVGSDGPSHFVYLAPDAKDRIDKRGDRQQSEARALLADQRLALQRLQSHFVVYKDAAKRVAQLALKWTHRPLP